MSLVSCSSGSNSSNSSTGGNTGNTGGASGPRWTIPLSYDPGSNENGYAGLSVSTSMIETENGYFTVVSTYNPFRSIILAVNKENGATGSTEIPDYYILNFVPDSEGSLLTLNETGEFPDSTVRLTVFSREGEKLREALFSKASLQYSKALAKFNNGVVFGMYKSDGPVLVKSDFDGNVIWERRFADELDPNLKGEEYIEPGVIQCVKKDIDGNFVIAQQLIKKNTEDLLDSGYAIYQVTPDGELNWSKPYYLGVTAWQQNTFARKMLLLEDGSIVIEESSVGGDPGQDIGIKYLDNEGDFIRNLYYAHAGTGPLALSNDQCVIYANKEIQPDGSGEVCYKFALDGTTIWNETYSQETIDGTKLSLNPYAINRCSDNGFLIVCRYFVDNTNGTGIALLKIDKNGKLISQLSL